MGQTSGQDPVEPSLAQPDIGPRAYKAYLVARPARTTTMSSP